MGCGYLCFHLLYTFDGWVPILDFIYKVFYYFANHELVKKALPNEKLINTMQM
jgi:hypothetical protein